MLHGNNMARVMVMGCMVLTASRARSEKPAAVKMVFCVPGPKKWSLHRFKPLIDPRAKTEFGEMSLAGPLLLEFKLRRFSASAETAFDYKFDADGRLNSLNGSVTVFGSWIGEANLFPNADGTVPLIHAKYQRDGNPIPKPDDATDYIGLLETVPVYRTAQAVPCGVMLKEAEKMNATQE